MVSIYYINDILREFLVSVIPIFFYLFAKNFTKKEIKLFYLILFYSICFITLLGVLEMMGFSYSQTIQKALWKMSTKANFLSYYGGISMGYLAQLSFAIILFDIIKLRKYSKLLMGSFFFIISIMTLQRSSYIGLASALLVYFLLERKREKFWSFLYIGALSVTFYLLLTVNYIDDYVGGYDFSLFVYSELSSINFQHVLSDRANQAIINNVNNVFNILFGEGFGKYSSSNSQAIREMPDASYYRAYNELGIIGGLIFFIPFIALMIQMIKKRNMFMIYFIGFTFFAFFFNRIIWVIPLNFIVYTMLGVAESSEYNNYLFDINSNNKHRISSRE